MTTPHHTHRPTPEAPLRVLFICLGNICRSPAAHGVMQHLVAEAGLADSLIVDSAGIGPWHVGELPDRRMRDHGARRGYVLDHRARQFDARTDFDRFDLIVTMDHENYSRITSMAATPAHRAKVVPMSRYLSHATSVPDPYYGTGADFDLALDLIEEGCTRLLDELITR